MPNLYNIRYYYNYESIQISQHQSGMPSNEASISHLVKLSPKASRPTLLL